MSAKEAVKSELESLVSEASKLADGITDNHSQSWASFVRPYQAWYTRALKIVTRFAPDRLAEFRGYYEVDPKRKTVGETTYAIQDYIRGVGPREDPRTGKPYYDAGMVVQIAVTNQSLIVASLRSRIDGVLADIETTLAANLEDAALETANRLAKVSLRAAGALAGVVLEEHLQRVAQERAVQISKKHPTIADLNDPLKQAGVYDVPTWRRIQYLADLRNLCAHKKDTEPTKEQVEALLDGANWTVKHVH